MPVSSIVILLWIPIAASLFAFLRPVKALTLAYLIGWLALPMAAVPVPKFWDIDKILATNVGVAIGAFLFCPGRFRGWRMTGADAAIGVFVFAVCLSSLTNDLGLYDGVSSMTQRFFYYACPFFFGRALLKERRDLIEACRLVVLAAAVYTLPALWEWRMSPQIHRTLYGYFQHGFAQHYRWGFYRPIVCFPHALGLGMFMGWAAVLAYGMHRQRALPAVWGLPPVVLVAGPLLGVLASMSLGPWALTAAGLGGLLLWRDRRRRALLWVLPCFAFIWMGGRYSGVVQGDELTSLTGTISKDRADSLQYRVDAERVFVAHARKRPLCGWGGWGRNRPPDAVLAIDGLWIIIAGSYGLFGLIAFFVWWCWPIGMSRRAGRELEVDPVLPALLIAVGMQSVNLLFNGFLSPVLTLLNGGAVSGVLCLRREARARRRRQQALAWVAARGV